MRFTKLNWKEFEQFAQEDGLFILPNMGAETVLYDDEHGDVVDLEMLKYIYRMGLDYIQVAKHLLDYLGQEDFCVGGLNLPYNFGLS